MDTLTPSRRNVMRALAAITTGLPTLAYASSHLACVPMADDTSAWDAAMFHYLKVKADGETFDRSHLEPHFEAARTKFGESQPFKGEPGWPEYQEWCASSGFNSIADQFDVMARTEGDAQVALLKMPAPNLAALRWKLEQTFETDGEIALWSEKIALTIRSDFLRLLPMGGEA